MAGESKPATFRNPQQTNPQFRNPKYSGLPPTPGDPHATGMQSSGSHDQKSRSSFASTPPPRKWCHQPVGGMRSCASQISNATTAPNVTPSKSDQLPEKGPSLLSPKYSRPEWNERTLSLSNGPVRAIAGGVGQSRRRPLIYDRLAPEKCPPL
jgi:hypothetical protein